MFIEDGRGSGRLGRVDKNQNLGVQALIVFPLEAEGHQGMSYSIGTDFINITNTATFTGFLYVINTSATHLLHVAEIRGSSTQNTQWKLIKNPTAGTLISGGTILTPGNFNFASGKEFQGSARITSAGAGLTITDGTHMTQWMNPAYSTSARDYQGAIGLYSGNSLALMVKPTAASDIGASIACWFAQIENGLL